MTRILPLIACAGLLVGLASCPSYVDSIFEQKVAQWQHENPDQMPTPEVLATLREEAIREAERDTQDIISSGGGAAGSIASGNYVGGALGIIGLLGLILGIRKKHQQGRKR